MQSQPAEFIRFAKHPLKFRIFLLTKLPAAFFSGVRVLQMDETRCAVKVPYGWMTRNPFRSTYFACLSMAAEMSTGALAMAHIYRRKPDISMLVTKTEGHYFKKAKRITIFECLEGKEIRECIEESIAANDGRTIIVKSTGSNPDGEKVAEFYITWSFRPRTV